MSDANANSQRSTSLPLGFGGSYDEHEGSHLNLNQLLIARPASTFFVKVEGDEMAGAGLANNDKLIVDRSLDPISGDIVIAVLEGQLVVRQFERNESHVTLRRGDESSPLIFTATDELEIWGVVTSSIRQFRA